MVDDTRFADVAAVNGDHVDEDELVDMGDGSASFPSFEGQSNIQNLPFVESILYN